MKRRRERGVCIKVRKEKIIHRLEGDLRETDTEGSFGAGYLNGRVGYHGVVSVTEPKRYESSILFHIMKVVPRLNTPFTYSRGRFLFLFLQVLLY